MSRIMFFSKHQRRLALGITKAEKCNMERIKRHPCLTRGPKTITVTSLTVVTNTPHLGQESMQYL